MRSIRDLEVKHSTNMAQLYMVIGMSILNLAFIFVKLSDASIYQILQERAFIVSLMGSFTCKDNFYPKGKTIILVIYGIFLVLAAPLYFIAIRTIPMAESVIIDQTNTIWAQFVAYFILGEQLDRKRFQSLFICLGAVILIIRPPFLFGGDSLTTSNHTLGCLIAFLASIFEAISYTIIRLVGSEVNPIIISQYYQILIQLLVSFLQFYIQFERQTSLQYYIYLLIVSICTYTFSIFFFRSMSMVSYAKLAPFSFISVFNSLIIDFFFGDIPNILSIIGGAIIITQILKQIRE